MILNVHIFLQSHTFSNNIEIGLPIDQNSGLLHSGTLGYDLAGITGLGLWSHVDQIRLLGARLPGELNGDGVRTICAGCVDAVVRLGPVVVWQ